MDDPGSFDSSVGPASDSQQDVNALREELVNVQGQLKVALGSIQTLQSDLAGMFITGKGFSGYGPRGISYTAPAPALTSAAPMEYDLTLCDDTQITVLVTSVTPP